MAVKKQALDWQPIETAPMDGTWVLGFWRNGERNYPGHMQSVHYMTEHRLARRYGGSANKYSEGWWSQSDREMTDDPDFWAPLPNQPRRRPVKAPRP
jgi:hypothetical protein